MKKIAIICALDNAANSNMPLAIAKHFKKRGYKYTLYNTLNLFAQVKEDKTLFIIHKIQILLLIHLNDTFHSLFNTLYAYFPSLKPNTYYYFLKIVMSIGSYALFTLLRKKNYDVILCENALDSKIFLYPLAAKKFYDCPTPFADELYYGGLLTDHQYKKILHEEITIYKTVDYLTFHWKIYTDYTKKYHYDGKNLLYLDSGCSLQKQKAQFAVPPRIIYLGSLNGYWINLDLLSELSKMYPHIDVYGFPEPDQKYNLNYKGYAEPEVMKDYQFGLITISKDRLRREGTSAKHVEYLSWGLPVLVPEWRTSVKTMKGTLLYNKKNFLSTIEKYSKKTEWTKLSQEAVKEAKNYSWDKILKPIDIIISDIENDTKPTK